MFPPKRPDPFLHFRVLPFDSFSTLTMLVLPPFGPGIHRRCMSLHTRRAFLCCSRRLKSPSLLVLPLFLCRPPKTSMSLSHREPSLQSVPALDHETIFLLLWCSLYEISSSFISFRVLFNFPRGAMMLMPLSTAAAGSSLRLTALPPEVEVLLHPALGAAPLAVPVPLRVDTFFLAVSFPSSKAERSFPFFS